MPYYMAVSHCTFQSLYCMSHGSVKLPVSVVIYHVASFPLVRCHVGVSYHSLQLLFTILLYHIGRGSSYHGTVTVVTEQCSIKPTCQTLHYVAVTCHISLMHECSSVISQLAVVIHLLVISHWEGFKLSWYCDSSH